MLNIRQTSKLAYKQIQSDGFAVSLKDRVFKQLEINPGTIREISEIMHITPNIISPRINELRKDGLIVMSSKRKCLVSGKLAMVWASKQREPQIELF